MVSDQVNSIQILSGCKYSAFRVFFFIAGWEKKKQKHWGKKEISKFHFFTLRYSWFTILCWFQVYNQAIWFYIYIYISLRLLSLICYYKILNIVLCVIQQVPVALLFCIQQCASVNPTLLIYPSPLLFVNPQFVFCICESVSIL